MKYFKKTLIIFVLPLIMLSFLFINAEAKSNPPVSPGLSVIASSLEMRKSGLSNASIYFTDTDFEEYMGIETIKSITVTSLPSEFEGKLYLGDIPVIANQTINKKDIQTLRFEQSSPEIKTSAFHFTSNDMSCSSSVKCSLFMLTEINTSPVISVETINQGMLSTQKNIMVYSTLKADDPENDEIIFEITTQPKHGIVSLKNSKSGNYTYTPAIDYTGKDSFEYVAYDIYGNRSEKVWVDINIEKNKDNIFYQDMLRHENHNAAVKVTQYNIMSGSLNNGEMCFSPDSTPTRAEFVTMALKATGNNSPIQAIDTGFTDDSDIPSSLKGYIAYASEKGYISGTKTEQGVYFYPNSPITRAEAAVVIGNILNTEKTEKTLSFSDREDIPSWAEEDISSLTQMGIIEALSDGSYSPNSNITNIQAAEIFCNIIERKETQKP